jgi:DNA-binding LacI/PurR family transcriptional regulator
MVGRYKIPEMFCFLCFPLSTISQNVQLLGEQAVQGIVKMIQARQENRPVIMQSKFIKPTPVDRKSSMFV